MTSLCPKLGKMYAEEFKGSCPPYMKEPSGKTLNISFIGVPPYVTYNPLGDSEFLVIKILAKKFSFIPKFIPAMGPPVQQDQVRNYNPLACIASLHELCEQIFGSGSIYTQISGLH